MVRLPKSSNLNLAKAGQSALQFTAIPLRPGIHTSLIWKKLDATSIINEVILDLFWEHSQQAQSQYSRPVIGVNAYRCKGSSTSEQ